MSRFAAQVARTPDAPALVFDGRTMTYRALDRRANRVARRLVAAGVRPDDRVALCAVRSFEMVVGMYAIQKAGAAYLPLDPELPAERMRLIAAEAGVHAVVTHGDRGRALADGVRTIVDLDDPATVAAPVAFDALDDAAPTIAGFGSRHLAYVLYTSGSTGQPKGVMLEHQAVVNRLDWMQRTYPLAADDVVLQKTPYGFDVSVWEFFWPLSVGATLVIARPDSHKDPEELVATIRAAGVTTLHFVPSMLDALLSFGGWSSCRSVRRVFCSGEALSADLVARFFDTGTASELHNLYGPTEAAIDVSHWDCGTARGASTVPIGRPIQNIQLYVVDARQRLVPDGTPGELLIGGDGLARGYLARPGLTAQTFIANPFAPARSSRVYRTGDLVRLAPGGEIEYLGRIDNQVKVNGFRIELGEVEHHLVALPTIRQAAVVAHREPGQAARLVAYLVPTADGAIAIADVRQALAATLPAYMIPSVFVTLAELPTSANGKLDRKRLPRPEARAPGPVDQVPPHGATEERLAAAWQANLGLARVGVTDDYFALGGDSIRSIALVAEARAHGVRFQVKDLFVHPTIRALAAAIDRAAVDAAADAPFSTPGAFDLITDDEKDALLAQFS